ncbi:GNAT family N-acetyltransferase [Geobacter pickeringii]|uniref:Acetyltransferase n=1 Tax=Geobacter pickeringii TaxID=345632 RepID=A0A0B5BHM4_9BACT|nr:GNAT family N-acetyltransferase [Geobacter pickeringii]AJE03536.1 acetyltransferase [Geobacter pickeringii]
MKEQIFIRNAMPSDLEAVIALDDTTPVAEKQAYWNGIFEHYVNCGHNGCHFLVAEISDKFVGFIVGEVRAWEFGSTPCGWVFALSVSSRHRKMGVGQRMFEEICKCLKAAGAAAIRTMVERDNKLTLSFFRNQGLSSGRYVELESSLVSAAKD